MIQQSPVFPEILIMIKVTDLTKYYGDVQALKGINFSVKPGEIVGLLGPNGAVVFCEISDFYHY